MKSGPCRALTSKSDTDTTGTSSATSNAMHGAARRTTGVTNPNRQAELENNCTVRSEIKAPIVFRETLKNLRPIWGYALARVSDLSEALGEFLEDLSLDLGPLTLRKIQRTQVPCWQSMSQTLRPKAQPWVCAHKMYHMGAKNTNARTVRFWDPSGTEAIRRRDSDTLAKTFRKLKKTRVSDLNFKTLNAEHTVKALSAVR